MSTSYDLGKEGEALALQYFKGKGHVILAQRWRYGKAEIDLITRYNDTLHVIEVKTRSYDQVQSPEDAVGKKKQQLIISAAHEFIIEHQLDIDTQFDIITFVLRNGEWKMNYMPNAFQPSFW